MFFLENLSSRHNFTTWHFRKKKMRHPWAPIARPESHSATIWLSMIELTLCENTARFDSQARITNVSFAFIIIIERERKKNMMEMYCDNISLIVFLKQTIT